MPANESSAIRVHQDADLFRTAVDNTADVTGFGTRLVEKDYFCTLVLSSLNLPDTIIFKGGTCLSKVHTDFFRLSEDLDFTISLPINAARSARSKSVDPFRRAMDHLPPPFQVAQPLTGHNNSTQYNGAVRYTSLLDGHSETILLELSVREPLLMPAFAGTARTLLLDPLSGTTLTPGLRVQAISAKEAFAEKFRAALSRREVAIRDFFDLDHAVHALALNPDDPAFIHMVRQKLAIPGNAPVQTGEERIAELRAQMDAQLQPVLRARDFTAFNLNRAFELVKRMARTLQA